jgi:DNA-binding MarR family transcriptional regulator
MNSKADLEKEVLMAAAEYGINSVLFRNAMGRKLGLNITESECLSLLRIKGISTPTELARYTGLTTGSTTTMLDRLEKAGFITRRHNPNDRRGVLIEINSETAVTTAPLVAGVQKAHKELIASYSATELEIIADFLTRFTRNVKEHTMMIEQDLP